MTENPYAAYFKELEDGQETRKTTLESRAAGLVAVSGTLVTLLLALAGLGTKANATFKLTDASRDWLEAALVAFMVSSLLAILVGAPLVYRAVLASGMRWIINNAWAGDTPENAALRIAATRANTLGWNKRVNDIKAALLRLALIAQVIAVVFIAVAALKILDAAPT